MIVVTEKCVGCATCMLVCPSRAIKVEGKAEVIQEKCEKCKKCLNYCPVEAIKWVE